MTKRYLLALVLIILFKNQGFSQIKISGQINDNNNKPIENIEIQLQNQDSIIVKSELTSIDGKFIIETEKGEFLLIIRQLGVIYHSQKMSVNQDTDIGVINITERNQQLEEIVIVSKKKLIERKVDRLVFNVENSISASGGDAIDALKVTPGITVNNDQVAMIGKSGMAVMVNDRIIQLRGEDVVNYLKTLSSDDIKKIEVITTPPAKYDAEGNSGLINIVLKQGALNSWSNSIRSAYIQTTYPSVSMGNTFNYIKNKFNLRASVDGKIGNELVREKTEIVYPEQKWITENNRKVAEDFFSIDVMTDYKLTENSKIGIQYILNNRKPNEIDNFIGNVFLKNGIAKILSNGNLNENNKNNSLNLHFHQTLDTIGRKIGLEIDYVNYQSLKERNFLTKSFDINQNQSNLFSGLNDGSQKIDIYSARIDIEHPNKWINLSYGGKFTTTKTNNNVSFFDTTSGMPIIDLTQTDNFLYTENTQAAYINGNKSLSEKWSIQLGLRYEFTQTLGESISLSEKNETKYKQLFPTFYLQHIANENNVFNLNYSKRINRPSFWELNPFKWYINQYTYAEGNPFLQPSFADNIELSYVYKSKLITTIFYQNTTNGFGQVPFVNENTLEQVFTRKNYYNSTNIGVSEVYIFNKYNWWQSQNVFYAFYTKANLQNLTFNLIPQESFAYYVATNNTFVLNKSKNFHAEVNLWYNSRVKSIIYDQENFYSLDFGLKYFLMNKNLQVSFIVNDVFKASFANNLITTNDIPTIFNIYNDNRYFKLSINYKFGNKKIEIEEKESSLEEKGRIK